jgi:hypothetical protein
VNGRHVAAARAVAQEHGAGLVGSRPSQHSPDAGAVAQTSVIITEAPECSGQQPLTAVICVVRELVPSCSPWGREHAAP